jgi:hypothetical protein
MLVQTLWLLVVGKLWINRLHDNLKGTAHGIEVMTAKHGGFISHDKFGHAYQLVSESAG